ncbi:MAG: DAK2 domain-containing protein [Clostridiales bacterium]|nr:DAK2 domain-containing protein [Clostridiales bacterium]
MKINGDIFRDMVISAANALDNHKEEINNLNVFPVPDGDTGINMSLTMSQCRTDLSDFDGTLSDCAEKIAGLMLRGARGNSGVILSVFFRGMAKSLKDKTEADAIDMAKAMSKGVEDAYKAVMTPTEGTILTVMRVCAEQAMAVAESTYKEDAVGFFQYLLSVAVDTLGKTPDMLPVLKQANVVDSGGQGFVTILEGMLASLEGKPVVCNGPAEDAAPVSASTANFDQFNTENIKFSYCTECIVTKSEKYFGEEKAGRLHKYIMGMGDSVVFIENADMIKLHVHTNAPGKVLTEALKYGSLFTVKIENMRNQHTALVKEKPVEKPAEKPKKYGFVTVCMGDGLKACFEDLGVDFIVYGGQTMNPSTDDLLHAVSQVNAENVFILPNNKNIYMVAKQAEELSTDKKVMVIPTRSVPQGLSALMAFDENVNADKNMDAMLDAIGLVKTFSVTYAVRDSVIGENTISEGAVLGLAEGKIACVADNDLECVKAMTERMKDASMITLFYGEDVSEEEAAKAGDLLREAAGDYCEVVVLSGGQPLYHYIISVE